MAKKTVKRAKAKTVPKVTATTTESVATPTSAPTSMPEFGTVEAPTITEVSPKHGHKLFLGAWAYVLGLLIALIAAVFRPAGLEGYTITVLAVFGIVVGLLNITDEEVLLFLVASLAFIVSASSVRAVLPESFELLRTLLHGIIIFTGAGAFVVAFKALFKVAKSE